MILRNLCGFHPLFFFLVCGIASPCFALENSEESKIPQALQVWEGWALWNDLERDCPTAFDDPKAGVCFWPSIMELVARDSGLRFRQKVVAYRDTWAPIPGDAEYWPLEVTIQEAEKSESRHPVAVLSFQGKPAVLLPKGTYLIEGVIPWRHIPRGIHIPVSTGLISLIVSGGKVEVPAWEENGFLWLRRDKQSVDAGGERDSLRIQVSAKLEDGIPLWLTTEVQLVVSGKNREIETGAVLPPGWKLAEIDSRLPTAMDELGRLKVQVRPGQWSIRLRAFRTDNPTGFAYESSAPAAVEYELVAFHSAPEFRTLEFPELPLVDASQFVFPDEWKNFPVYRWSTSTPFRLEERARGSGTQRAEPLHIHREWWLDQSGKGYTFRDQIRGARQEIWRLDASAGTLPSGIRSAEQPLLLTKNPETGATGVEVRSRTLDLTATGIIQTDSLIAASGWEADATDVKVQLHLPPGWRLFAVRGADWSFGDWVTSWTLMDLFLVLIFTFAVQRLAGWIPAIFAFAVFTLTVQEPDAPKFLWLALLIPLALLGVIREGRGRQLIILWKWGTVALLLTFAVPFVISQIQQMLYPQLEYTGSGEVIRPVSYVSKPEPAVMSEAMAEDSLPTKALGYRTRQPSERNVNLLADPDAKVQTGTAVPGWRWRTAEFGWSGPVSPGQTVTPVLISMQLEQFLSFLRVILMSGLLAFLLGRRPVVNWAKINPPPIPSLMAGCLLVFVFSGSAKAQFPDAEMLENLRQRILSDPLELSQTAEIPHAELTLEDRVLTFRAEVHSSKFSAVPMPGRFPAWSPLSISVNGAAASALRRDRRFLWVALPAGVHQIEITGLLGEANEWDWSFLLKPKRVRVLAPGWIVSGIDEEGRPSDQLLFLREQPAGNEPESRDEYAEQTYENLVVVERSVELGLVWQVKNTVRRLTPSGRALALEVPLLPGENVTSYQADLTSTGIKVQLGARQDSYSWQSEMRPVEELVLQAPANASWIEQWELVVSPMWHVNFEGVPPFYSLSASELLPTWKPWPTESVRWIFSRPGAIPGPTATVHKAELNIQAGNRQRTSTLDLSVESSIGDDFFIGLPDSAEITTLTLNGNIIPLRSESGKVVIPLSPGYQQIHLSWTIPDPLSFSTQTDKVILPVEAANIEITLQLPENRWILMTSGPLIGPAVQFWSILAAALLAAFLLGRIPSSPLSTVSWVLLAIGLTQVSVVAGLMVVAWFFLLANRGKRTGEGTRPLVFNFLQLVLIGWTLVVLVIFVYVVSAGLLGTPEMFIRGNGSTRTLLRWYEPLSAETFPKAECWSVSIWWYRFLMLAWALWLALSLLNWLGRGWEQFSHGKIWASITTVTKPQEGK